MQTVIKSYQIQASLPNSILKDTQPLPWLPHRWISNLREFLHSIEGKIVLENPWTIPKLQQYDTHIMDKFLQANVSPKDLQTLNNCRMYLQVTTLAEIATHDGTQILVKAFQRGQVTPSLQTISKSIFQWPNQPNPCKKAWSLWNRTIQTIYMKPGMTTFLKQPLGPWTPLRTRPVSGTSLISHSNKQL